MKKLNQKSHNIDYYDNKLKKYLQRLETADLVEDIKFREVAKSKEAVQEILRVILTGRTI